MLGRLGQGRGVLGERLHENFFYHSVDIVILLESHLGLCAFGFMKYPGPFAQERSELTQLGHK